MWILLNVLELKKMHITLIKLWNYCYFQLHIGNVLENYTSIYSNCVSYFWIFHLAVELFITISYFYDKRDDFNFHITNFPFLSSNIPSSPAYGVFISQLIRYSRACSSYECFILRARRLSSKLLKQGYLAERLKSSFRKLYGRYGDLIQQYEVSLSRMLNDILILDQQWLPNQSDFPPISWPWYRAWPSPIMSGFHGAFATGVACQQGTLTLPDTWFRPPFWDLLMLQLLRPNFSNLPCLYSTFHLEYPLVLSRFCYLHFIDGRNVVFFLITHVLCTGE